MSFQSNPIASLDLLGANPLFFSFLAYSAMMAFCLDFTDAVAARDALDLFPVRKP
jgi:hypothetical protein